jgi:7-carboxy-7-deazaguanine synthase
MLPYTEAFGATIQGEGPAAGRLSDFLRFGGCNLSCSWCDSAFTWDATQYNLREQISMLTAEEVLGLMPPDPAPVVIVTGGEPLMNQRKDAFIHVLEGLKERGQQIHIETNGTLVPTVEVWKLVDLFIVSPKLPHAGLHKRSQDPALAPGWRAIHPYAECHLKVVAQTPDDVARAVEIAKSHDWPKDRVWVMPEGITPDVINERWPAIANAAVEHRINACHRLHVLAWNDERGH